MTFLMLSSAGWAAHSACSCSYCAGMIQGRDVLLLSLNVQLQYVEDSDIMWGVDVVNQAGRKLIPVPMYGCVED